MQKKFKFNLVDAIVIIAIVAVVALVGSRFVLGGTEVLNEPLNES